MKETEIRSRIQAAMGNAPYPPELTPRVVSRLADPSRSPGAPRLVSLVAALLAVAIVATLVLIRFQSVPRTFVPEGAPPQASPAAAPSTPPAPAIIGVSQSDLDRTQLSAAGDLVTPLKLSSTNNRRTVTLVGAYADSARTVLFFRSMPLGFYPHVSIYDDTGFLNAGSTAGFGSIGDTFFVLDTGPRAGSDGIARLRVIVDSFESMPTNQTAPGNWTFSFGLKVQGPQALTLAPPLAKVGSWKFTVEAMELTSTLIHFQAVIDGAAVEDIKQDTVTLTDSSGHVAEQVSSEAGTTVPKSQVTSTRPRSTRINMTWKRPPVATNYVLAIVGGGSHYSGALFVPQPASPTQVPKGVPLKPPDYPVAPESLKIDGAFSAAIATGHPSQCGSGSGPSGMVFAFATWFQIEQDWYLFSASTDPSVRVYTGPGTYAVEGEIFPLGASAIFEGPMKLTVTSDKRPGPQTGTVLGTMSWTGPDSEAYTIKVSGNWTCTWSDQLGPG